MSLSPGADDLIFKIEMKCADEWGNTATLSDASGGNVRTFRLAAPVSESNPPVVDITYPDAGELLDEPEDFTLFTFTVTEDTGSAYCYYSINGGSTQYYGAVLSDMPTSINDFTEEAVEGENTVYVTCRDPSSNWGSDTIVFYVAGCGDKVCSEDEVCGDSDSAPECNTDCDECDLCPSGYFQEPRERVWYSGGEPTSYCSNGTEMYAVGSNYVDCCTPCFEEGESCAYDGQCCYGECSGTCQCIDIGDNGCDENADCCYGICSSATCECIDVRSGYCLESADCCDELTCDTGTHECCVWKNEYGCSVNEDCCNYPDDYCGTDIDGKR